MPRSREEIVKELLGDKDLLLSKRPFTRGGTPSVDDPSDGEETMDFWRRRAHLPHNRRRIVSQERFARELDPNCHDVLFDDNLPSICMKVRDGGYQELRFKRVGLGIQEEIRQKKTLSLTGNPRTITLHDTSPTDEVIKMFADLKWAWNERNMDGLGTKAVYGQQGYGDVGLLMYMSDRDEIRGRVLSYADGYVIISHNDDNGERVMECVYYADENDVEHVDCYDDTYMYRLYDDGYTGWAVHDVVRHGFSEIPLITKRGDVSWNNVQSLIEVIEVLWNIFIVIQKRHGWGILYIRGNIKDTVKKIAGSIILQDTSLEGNGTAEFKTPPSPENMIQTIEALMDELQRDASVTFILPKDVSASGDISGIAVQMTRALDIEWAASAVIEWQNFASKQMRLFKEGYAMELVRKGERKTALTDYAQMKVSCKYKMWQPFDEASYNQMLTTMKQGGIISKRTAIERNTVSSPDEVMRVLSEARDEMEMEVEREQLLSMAKGNVEQSEEEPIVDDAAGTDDASLEQ